MKKAIIISLLALVNFSYLQAQDAYHSGLLNQLQSTYNITGGSFVFGNQEVNKMAQITAYGATMTEVAITGQDFTLAKNILVTNPGSFAYSNAAQINNTQAISAGDKLLFVAWIKGISGETGFGITKIAVERAGPPYEQHLDVISQNADVWTQYIFPFEATENYAPSELHLAIQLGYQAQEMQIGGVSMLNFGTTYTLAELPQKNFQDYYAGIEPNATWRTAAATRIEQYRKANLSLEIVDSLGAPIENAAISLDMQCHDFAFGSAVKSTLFAGNSETNATYQDKLINMDGQGHGFNMVVFENDLKWDAWEGNWPGTVAEKENASNWLASNDIRLRGHTLVWPAFQYMPDYMETAQNDPATLMQHIDTHLQDILGTPFINNNVEEWDIINEITVNRDLEYAFAGYQNYTTGREIYPEIIDKAAALAPNAKRYMNDYMTITSGGLNTTTYNRYKSFLTEIANSTDFDGIGFQSHINTFPVAPETVYEILEDFHTTYGKEMKITEFDMAGVNPSIGYEYMRDFLTISFSHEAVNGFLAWGFWDGAHWYDNAPFYDVNWNLKPGGQAFIDLVFNDWWSNETASSSPTGNAMIRAFKGKHLVTVSYDGITEVIPVVLGEDQTLQIVLDGQGGCLPAGTACDDDNPNTENDVEDGLCNCAGSPILPDPCNLLTNGDFDIGVSSWDYWGHSPVQIGGEAFLEISTPGANPWNVGFTQSGIPLELGKQYEISFDARASTNRSINVKCGMDVAPYSAYFNGNVQLTTSMNSYNLSFTMTDPTDLNGKFEFHIGQYLGDIFLDNVIIKEVSCGQTQANISVLLEGCYDSNNGQLSTTLNDLNLLPGQSANPSPSLPYALAPWSYDGTEAQNFDNSSYTSIANDNGGKKVVDWVLLGFRTTAAAETTVGKKAALLLQDGSLVFPSPIDFLEEDESYYIHLSHWSHTGVLTTAPVLVSAGQISHDFRTQDSYQAGLGVGSKEMALGIWALYAGNGAQESDFYGYDTNGSDKQVWTEQNGTSANYLPTDYNMDGDVNAADKQLWESNNGQFSEVEP